LTACIVSLVALVFIAACAGITWAAGLFDLKNQD
jgi:hypothetical protein